MAASPTIEHGKGLRLPWWGVILALTLVGGAGAIYFRRAQRLSTPDQNIKTILVQQVALPITIEASGKVVPIQTVNLSPKVGGKLVALLVEQGDTVEQGEVIAKMDATNIEPQVAQARSNLSSAQANLERLKNGSRPEEVNAAKAQVELAKSRASLAQKRLARFQDLSKQGVISRDRLDELVTEAESANATLEDRQKQWERLVNGSRSEDIAQAIAQVKEAEARLKQAEVQREDTLIRAPFSGIVAQKYTNIGAFVTPTTSASSTSSATSTSVVALSRGLEILAEIPEVDIRQVTINQPVEIVADAFPDERYQGKVRLIAPEAIVQQNVTSFQVRIDLVSGQKRLLSGMNVELQLIGKAVPNALVVPTVAIVTEKGQNGVYVATTAPNQPEFRPVTIGTTVKQQTQILSGLKEGEKVYLELPKTLRRPGES